DVRGEGLATGVNPQDLLASGKVRGVDQHLPVETTGSEQRRVEILKPVRGAHHDDLVALLEAVELDEELVQGLVLFAVEAMTGTRRTDGVELVDEHDRRCVASRLLEQLPDPRSPEAGEHLDESGSALHVEARPGLA